MKKLMPLICLFLLVIAAGCAAKSVVGTYEASVTPPGTSQAVVLTLDLKEDKTYTMGIGPMTMNGKYEVKGSEVILTDSSGGEPGKFTIEGDGSLKPKDMPGGAGLGSDFAFKKKA